MTVVEEVLGSYLRAALGGAEAELVEAELVEAELVEAELVEAEIVDDADTLDDGAQWDPEDVVDAEVIEDAPTPPPAADTSDHGLLQRLAGLEQAIARLHAEQVELLAEFGRRRSTQLADDDDAPVTSPGPRRDFAAEELAAVLGWTSWTATHRLEEAERLAACLPRTWSALAQGRLDYARVRRIVAGTRLLGEDDASVVDAAVADRARGLTTAQLDELLAVEVAAVDAAAAARRAATATKRRRVGVEPQPDGQALLVAEGPAADILTIMTALTAAAGSRAPDDERGIDARRFDALRDWARDALTRQEHVRAPWRPHVLLTVALPTVLGLDEYPGHLHGYGPLPASVCRQIAAEGTLRRLFTDPVTGLVVGIDGHTYPGGVAVQPPGGDDPPDDGSPGPDGGGGPSRGGGGGPSRGGGEAQGPPGAEVGPCPVAAAGGGRYRPGRVLDRFIRHRDTTCTAPGCRRTAVRCDVDHIVPHPLGPTCPCNLHALCRRHHRMKHLTGVRVARQPTGDTVWTMPTGHVVTRLARPPLLRPRVRTMTRTGGAESMRDGGYPPGDTAAHGIAGLADAVQTGADAGARAGKNPTPDPLDPPPF